MLSLLFMDAPKYKEWWVMTPAMAASRSIFHPAVGAIDEIDVTNPIVGTIDTSGLEPIYVPDVDFFGIAHIIARVGNVRALGHAWVVPDDVPRYSDIDTTLKLYPTFADIRTGNYLHPRPGARDWADNLAWVAYDQSTFGTPIKKGVTVSHNIGTNEITGVMVNPGMDVHTWYVIKRHALGHWYDITADCSVVYSNDLTAAYTVPGTLNATDYSMIATDLWDCWVAGVETWA